MFIQLNQQTDLLAPMEQMVHLGCALKKMWKEVTPKLEAHLLKQGGDSGAKVWKMCEMVYSKLQYKVQSKAVIDGLHLLEISLKEI